MHSAPSDDVVGDTHAGTDDEAHPFWYLCGVLNLKDDVGIAKHACTHSQVQALIAQMEVHRQRARRIAEYVADLQEKCGDLLDPAILKGASRVASCKGVDVGWCVVILKRHSLGSLGVRGFVVVALSLPSPHYFIPGRFPDRL